jgi:hypothetical protein
MQTAFFMGAAVLRRRPTVGIELIFVSYSIRRFRRLNFGHTFVAAPEYSFRQIGPDIGSFTGTKTNALP